MAAPSTPSSDTVAVVVINWNGWRHTQSCIESLRRSQDTNWRLYLVDNASTDDSLSHFTDLGDNVVVIRSPKNAGWTGGNNLGITRALEDGHNLIFVLNNDAVVEADTLGVLRAVLRENASALPILGPLQRGLSDDGYSFVGADTDPYTGMPRLLPVEGVERRALPPTNETSYVRGAGLFAHRRHFEVVGLFDDAYFLFYDESDWCWRARKSGFKSLMVRDAVIRHVGSASMGGDYSPLKLYFLIRNALLFAERHLTLRQRLRLARNYTHWARSLVEGNSEAQKIWAFLVDRGGHARAFKAAARDYVLRRFGDCPDWIRGLSA